MTAEASVWNAAGEAAKSIETVTWVLIGGGALIFGGVMVLLAVSMLPRARTIHARWWIGVGGIAFPVAVLVALFVWALPLTPSWKPLPPAGALIVTIKAHMWWLEVHYRDPATGAEVATANDIRLPVGRPVFLALTSADVIHSFWVPQLAGKMDMLPGRMQHLLVTARESGTWRGQCAEFCGEQHARMALQVTGVPPDAFDAWLARQAQPASPPASPAMARGHAVFFAQRCNACHTVRGTEAQGRLGPDLTHVGSRPTLGAGTLPNTPEGRARWLANVQSVKAGARMPSYDRLEPEALQALSAWLGSLQ